MASQSFHFFFTLFNAEKLSPPVLIFDEGLNAYFIINSVNKTSELLRLLGQRLGI